MIFTPDPEMLDLISAELEADLMKTRKGRGRRAAVRTLCVRVRGVLKRAIETYQAAQVTRADKVAAHRRLYGDLERENDQENELDETSKTEEGDPLPVIQINLTTEGNPGDSERIREYVHALGYSSISNYLHSHLVAPARRWKRIL